MTPTEIMTRAEAIARKAKTWTSKQQAVLIHDIMIESGAEPEVAETCLGILITPKVGVLNASQMRQALEKAKVLTPAADQPSSAKALLAAYGESDPE